MRDFDQLEGYRGEELPPNADLNSSGTSESGGVDPSLTTDSDLTLAATLTGSTIARLLRERNFVPLWIGQVVSYIGDQFILIAALAVLNQYSPKRPDGTTSLVPTIIFGISVALPQILFGLTSGVIVDRLDRKWTMIVADLVRAAAMFALLFVNKSPDRFWIIYLSMFVVGTAQMFFYPARASALASILPKRQLAGANALLELGFVVALIFGSGLAGIIVGQVGENVAFGFNTAAFLFSAVMIAIIAIPSHVYISDKEKDEAAKPLTLRVMFRQLVEGLRYVWNNKSMRAIMLLSSVVSATLGAVIILVLDYLTNELNINPSEFGIIIGVLGIGVVIGGVLIQRLSKFLPTNRLVALSMVLQAGAVASFVFNPSLEVVRLATVFVGFSLVVSRTVLSTLVQAIPPEEYRGRVQSTFNLISQAPQALAIGGIGVLVTLFTRQPVIIGLALLLVVIAVVTVRTLRGIDEAIYGK